MNTIIMPTRCARQFFLSIPVVLSLLFDSSAAGAQLLKRIINDVKQTAQNRADSKTTETTNKAIDKIGSSKSSKPGSSSSGDSSSVNKVLGAFAKAAQDNPNDTSSADLTMKALGNLVGGGGVSAADSAAAIKEYTSATGGAGIYYEYTIDVKTKQNSGSQSVSRMYMTNGGEGRSEMNIAAMMGARQSGAMVVIGRASHPTYSITLDDDEKSYSLNVIDTSLINGVDKNCRVTKIGDETVQGYHCIHVRMTTTYGSGMFKSASEEDIWTSVDVPGYAIMKKTMMQQNVTPQLFKALEAAGCAGFVVKMSSGGKNYSMTMQLTKAEKQNFPASLFKIPAGYTESSGNLMLGNMINAAKKQ